MKAEDRLKELIEKEEINSLDGAKKEGFIQGWNEALRIHNVSYCAEQTKNVLTKKFCNIAKKTQYLRLPKDN